VRTRRRQRRAFRLHDFARAQRGSRGFPRRGRRGPDRRPGKGNVRAQDGLAPGGEQLRISGELSPDRFIIARFARRERAMGANAFAAVGIGAAFGAWLRWALAAGLNAAVPNFPLGTFAANVVGGYLIGVAMEYFSGHA